MCHIAHRRSIPSWDLFTAKGAGQPHASLATKTTTTDTKIAVSTGLSIHIVSLTF